MNGKGSSRRPTVVTEAEAVDRWAATFGKQLAETDKVPDLVLHEQSGEDCGKQRT
jgi:hypothetical protein